jgi:NMD protein affecting ribosome stability and mRNA decay
VNCQECGEEVEELITFKVGRKKRKMCEDCIELAEEQLEIAAEAESAMQDMMEYKGR